MDRSELKQQLTKFITSKARAWNKNTLRRNNFYFKMLLEFMEDKHFDKDTLEEFFNSMKDNYAESTRNKCEEGVLSFVKWLYDEEIIARNWGQRITKTTVHKNPRLLPDQAEMLELIKKVTEPTLLDSRPTRFAKLERRACLSFILVACGGRNFETTNILREDISISGRQVLVRRGKMGPRMVTIPEVPWLIKDLERRVRGIRSQYELDTLSDKTHYKENSSDRLFIVNEDKLRETMNKVGKLWGSNLVVHDLRRVFARDLKKNGASDGDVMRALGHKDIKTTLGYLYDDPSEIQRILKSYSSEARKFRTSAEKAKEIVNKAWEIGKVVGEQFDGEVLTVRVRIG